MFERYTEGARRVLFFSRYEATQLGSLSIETEHVLLGLIRDGKGIASLVFARSHISLETVRKEIENRTLFRERVETSAEVPFSAETKRVLQYAAAEADRLAHHAIGTEHLLLGILRERGCVAATLLMEKGMDLDTVRESVVQARHEPLANDTTEQSVHRQDVPNITRRRPMVRSMRAVLGAQVQSFVLPSDRTEEVALALVLTVAAAALSEWRVLQVIWQRYLGTSRIFTYPTVVSLAFLALGLVLAIPTRHRSGLTWGHRPWSWWATAAVTGLPVLCVAIVYPLLPERPFAGSSRALWLISPAAQDLWFLGVVYGRLDAALPRFIHTRVPIRQALPLTAFFFALWHLPNLLSMMSPGYVVFQLAYVFTGCVLVGLSRQWTGTIIYATLSHMAVNYIAVSSS